MKYLYWLCCLQLICVTAIAQNDPKSVKFLKEIFAKNKISYYYERLYPVNFNGLKTVLSQRILLNNDYIPRVHYIKKKLLLTSAEVRFIQNELNDQADFKWEHGVINNAELLIRNDRKTDEKVNQILKNHGEVYSISKPIFIRNDSICLFYYDFICGGECGKGFVCVYRKVANKWKTWITMVQWIS